MKRTKLTVDMVYNKLMKLYHKDLGEFSLYIYILSRKDKMDITQAIANRLNCESKWWVIRDTIVKNDGHRFTRKKRKFKRTK